MSPYHDGKLQAIVGLSPGPGWIWCEECLRWEYLGGEGLQVHERPPPSSGYRFWMALARPFRALASFFSKRAIFAQAKHLVRTGNGQSVGRLRY